MPLCPGCEQPVSYDRLPVHERYCTELSDRRGPEPAVEHLDCRITKVERRMYRRLRALEAELDIKRSRTDDNGPTDGRSRTTR